MAKKSGDMLVGAGTENAVGGYTHTSHLSKDLDIMLKQDMFLSAENESVARKYQQAKNVTWRVPGLIPGNMIPSYDDEGGRVVRCLAVFSLSTQVTDRDTTLKDKIRRTELPAIVLQCIAAYHTLRERVGDDELCDHLPASVITSDDEIRASTRALYTFLIVDDDKYNVLHDEDAVTLTDLTRAFHNHVRIHRRDGAKWPASDDHHIKSSGFTVNSINACKQCSRPAKRESCGDHYDALLLLRNRKKLKMIEGMRLCTK